MGALFCKGLHCAGCGKGIPALIVAALLFVVLTMADVIATMLEIVLSIGAICGMVTAIIYAAFLRKAPVVNCQTAGKLTYSQMKFLQTGDTEWLGLTGGTIPVIGSVEDASPRHKAIERYRTSD